MTTEIKNEPEIVQAEKRNTLESKICDVKSEKLAELPTKSSMEILSELFSKFDAEPPIIVKEEKTEEYIGKKHKKKKKHKHKAKKHKKKSKKRHCSISNSSDEEGKVDLVQILIKQEKDSSAKKIKIEGTDLSLNLDINKSECVQTGEVDESDCKTPEGSPKLDSKKKKKIFIHDLKKSSVFDSFSKELLSEDESKSYKKERKHKKKHKQKTKKRSRSKSKDRSNKKVKKNDLRDILKDKESKSSRHKHSDKSSTNGYEEKSIYRIKDRERSKERNYDKHLYDKCREEYHRVLDDYKISRKDNPFYRNYKEEISCNSSEGDQRWSSRDRYRENENSRYRSSSRDIFERESSRFDKKKLLEIARKNAIAMMKSGSLPVALTLGPQAQEKVIAAIKSGGKSIEELTDFCKTLSKKEELGELSSLSEKDDSDSDTDKPFHHPFQIKERPTTITMNIKNSVPLPVKRSLERTTELRMQFPVSSGQHHRKGEDWRPGSPTPTMKIGKTVPVTVPIAVPVVAPVAAPTVSSIAMPQIITPTTVPTSSIPLPPDPTPTYTSMESTVRQQAEHVTPRNEASNTITTATYGMTSITNVDIGTIVSQRLAAIRKLQENPNDVQALSQMYKSNKEMQTWASSKQAPLGQFRGSTGAQILSQSELSSGYQAWAKKDQLQTAAPVSGGMGMHLLQKMGWKPGEGLGKEKTGSLEPLLLEVKLDKRGLVANEEQQRNKMKKSKVVAASVKNLQGKHPVSLLGEYASKRKIGAPQYILEFECGPDHKKNFLFKVVLNGVEYKPNIASNNKKEAKAAAASLCLQKIGLLPTVAPPPPIVPPS